MLPSGAKRFFVHSQHRGERVWKIIGDAAAMDVREARTRAVTMLAAIRLGEDPPRDPTETLFEAVAEAAFERRSRVWKPGTLAVNRAYLRSQILPHFAGRQVADIDSRDVANWFASLRATPVAADRSMPVLSVIMREAEAMGLRPEGSNPCKGIRRYRRKGRERLSRLSALPHSSSSSDAGESITTVYGGGPARHYNILGRRFNLERAWYHGKFVLSAEIEAASGYCIDPTAAFGRAHRF